MTTRHYTYRAEYVRCGKNCSGCPHGPYWYGYYRDDGTLKKRYFGRGDPRVAGSQFAPRTKPHPWDRIFDPPGPGTREVAMAILHVSWPYTEDSLKAAFRRRSLEVHPDRGGDERMQMRVNAAYAYLRIRA